MNESHPASTPAESADEVRSPAPAPSRPRATNRILSGTSGALMVIIFLIAVAVSYEFFGTRAWKAPRPADADALRAGESFKAALEARDASAVKQLLSARQRAAIEADHESVEAWLTDWVGEDRYGEVRKTKSGTEYYVIVEIPTVRAGAPEADVRHRFVYESGAWRWDGVLPPAVVEEDPSILVPSELPPAAFDR